jgi:hypothetical protein
MRLQVVMWMKRGALEGGVGVCESKWLAYEFWPDKQVKQVILSGVMSAK